MIDNWAFNELACLYGPYTRYQAAHYAIRGVPGLEFDDLVQEILIKLAEIAERYDLKDLDRVLPTVVYNRIASLYRFAIQERRDYRRTVYLDDAVLSGVAPDWWDTEFIEESVRKQDVDLFVDSLTRRLNSQQVLLLFELLYPEDEDARRISVAALSRSIGRSWLAVHRDIWHIRAVAAGVAYDMGWEEYIDF